VKFIPGMLTTLAAGSEDSIIRLYDLRAFKELGAYPKEKDYQSINSIAFSKSGQILFASSANSHTIHMWDILGDGTHFNYYIHEMKQSDKDLSKGIRQISLNSTGDTIAYALDDYIFLME